MIAASMLDPALSSRLCLMLVHSLWQVALLAAIVWCCERLLRWSVERRYLMHVAAMVAALVLLPVTFAVVDARTPGEAATARSVGVDAPQSISLAPIAVAAPLGGEVEATAPVSGPANPQAGDDVELAVQQISDAAVASAPNTAGWTTLAPWLAACYVVGVGLMLLRLMFGVCSAQRLVARSRPVSDSAILVRLEQLARRLSVRSRPVVAYSEQVLVPRIVGLLRPVILLPTSAMTGLAPEQVEMVLAHELTHLRRHDMWVNLLQRVAEAVLFFNPPLWYLNHRINVLREYACDDAVCRATSEVAADVRCRYAAALLQVAELSRSSAASGRLRRTPDAAELTTLAAAGRSPSQLRRRIARLVGEPIREPLHLSRGGLLTLLAVAVAVILSSPLWPVIAQTNERADKAEQGGKTTEDDDSQEATGDRVEVVAIGTHNEQPQRWWDANGEAAPAPSVEWQQVLRSNTDDRKWRRVVIRVRNLDKNEEVRWELPGITEWHGMQASTGKGSKPSRGDFAKQFVVPERQTTFRMRVGVATGKWKTVAELDTRDTLVNGRGEPSFVSSGVFEVDGGTTIFVSHDVFEHNFRIIAIDKGGQEHDTGARGGSSNGKVYQSRARFPNLPREQIDHFELQTRPYKWTEIDDLPLEPRADARNAGAVPEDRPALDATAVRLSDGTVVRLVGVSDNRDRSDDKDWWKPNGGKLAEAPYSEPGTYSNERTAYEFAFQVTGSDDFGFVGGRGNDPAVLTGRPNGVADMRAVVSSKIPASAREAEVTVGVATGKWQTVEEWKGYSWKSGVAGSSVIHNKKGVMLSWPRQQDDTVEVTLAHKYVDAQTRLVAFHEGRLLEVKPQRLGEGDGIAGAVYTFASLSLDDPFELAFQQRPYTWVRFRNVSLRLGHQTKPRAGLADTSMSLQTGESREWLELVQEQGGDVPTASAPQKLEEVLREWEEKTARITRLRGEHQQYQYDEAFGIEKRAVGEFWYEAPDKGRIDFKPAPLEDTRTGKPLVSRKSGAAGQPYKIEAVEPVTWVCDGKSIMQIEHETKTYGLLDIPPRQGGTIMDNLVPILFGINPLGADADRLRERYTLSLGSQHNKTGSDGRKKYHIVALPRRQSDARSWQRAEIILDARFCLPTAVRLIAATGSTETVYVFPLESMKANESDRGRNPFKLQLWGYKLTPAARSK